MKILAIESSCDETACAVVKDGVEIISSVVATSHEMHEKYGGIVPEVAARMQLESIIPVISKALAPLSPKPITDYQACIANNIDAIAVTIGPGLIGSLLVGVESAKTIALVTGKPIIPVNHVLAHMYANFVRDERNNGKQNNENNKVTIQQYNNKTIEFPAISLVVSGGHTELYFMKSPKDLEWLGGTIDDAAGECFDKTARLLGFGHGGGFAIQTAAGKFTVHSLKLITKLPRPMLDKKNEYNFSFSGLKTAILRETERLQTINQWNSETISNLAYEVQETITDVLVKKTLKAAEKFHAKSILLSGGVSANIRLREKFMTHNSTFTIHAPPVSLCTDNAVYIAAYAYFRGAALDWKQITAQPDLPVEISS